MAFGRPKRSFFTATGGPGWSPSSWIVVHTPFGTPIYLDPITQAIVHVGERTKSRAVRIIRRITRYVGLAGLLTLAGYAAGYYLTIAQAAGVAASVSLAGGIRATQLVAQDLARLGIQSRFVRWTLASKFGVGFALLPWIGAGTGFLFWGRDEYGSPFHRYVRDRIIAAGRRGLTGGP